MEPIILPQLSELETLRGNPVIFYASMIGDEGVRTMYECLRKHGRMEHLDLVLSTMGGNVTTTRQLALLLREYTQHLTVLVPYRARSSGTLLCLSADELLLGPMAELGPIDPHVSSVSPMPPDAPGMISAQDIRSFREMAEEWFGVVREEDRLQVLALVAQRIFPTSLSSFYRFDRLMKQIANELIKYQLPQVEASTRQRIVEQLVNGYCSHDYIVSRAEARKLGLRVQFASQQEETLLWELLQASRVYRTEHPGQAEEETIGLIASTKFSARQVSRWVDVPSWQRNKSHGGDTSQPEKIREVRWEIDV
jgi:hypothetical protein